MSAVAAVLVGVSLVSVVPRSSPVGAAPVMAATFQGLVPARVFDTRSGVGYETIDGQFSGGGKVGPGSVTNVTVVGRGGVPATGVGAVAVNVTVSDATAPSFITAYPAGNPRPTASNVNMVANQNVGNSVIVPVGADGQISLFNYNGNTHLILDVQGWFPTGPAFNGLVPSRVFDTRSGVGYETIDGQFSGSGKVGPGSVTNVTVVGRAGVPATGVGAVAVNVTVSDATAPSFITAYPAGNPRPTASNVNMVANQNVGNFVIVPVGADGQISLFNYNGNTDLILDVQGWFGLPVVDDGSPTTTVAATTTTIAATTTTIAPLPQPAVFLVSRDSAGLLGNGAAGTTAISADGNVIAFSSAATNLVAGDTNGEDDVFVRNLTTGITTRVSVATGGGQGNGDSEEPALSADGRYVAFHSFATNLAGSDGNAFDYDVFRHDLVTGETVRISVLGAGTAGNGASSYPSISGDGNLVSFVSRATNLVADDGDTNGHNDVFVRNVATSTTTRVSVTSTGAEATGGSSPSGGSIDGALSPDGAYIAFSSDDTNLDTTVNAGQPTSPSRQVYLRHLAGGPGSTVMISVTPDGAESSAATTPEDLNVDPSVSADGRYVAFHSRADNLVVGDTNGTEDVYRRDTLTGETVRVAEGSSDPSVVPPLVENAAAGGNTTMSSDGRFISYRDIATSDVFVRDMVLGTTTKVSFAIDGAQANGPSADTAISGDGSRVVFHSDASNLVEEDTNGVADVFVYDSGV